MAEFNPPFEIDPEMVPIQGFNPLFTTVAPPRQVMMGGNLAQSNVIFGATRKRQRSGLERQHARGTFMQKFDHDCHILEIIPRFTEFDLNPLDLVIFERADTGQLDVLEVPSYHVLHPHYGFMFKRRDDVEDRVRRPGARIPAGTILGTSPNVTEDGDYMPGVELNICNLDDPAIAEDALVFSDEVAGEIFKTTGIETRIISCGKTHYPTNVNGTEKIYLPVPELGQQILSNGLICALRPKDKFLDPIYMSKRKLLSTVYGMDEPCFGKPNATVIDIKVYHNEQIKSGQLPPEMTQQFRKYYEADKEFYRKLLEVTMCRNSKLMSEDVNLSDNLWVLVNQAINFLGPSLVEYGMWPKSDAARLSTPRIWRGHEMDEWQVHITFAYETAAAIGPKATDLAGSKGVNVAIWPKEHMPVDKFGNRADIIASGFSTVNRSNPARMHEQAIGAAGRDVIKRVRRSYGLGDMAILEYDEVMREIKAYSMEHNKAQYEYILGFYEIVSKAVDYTKSLELFQTDEVGWLNDLCHIILDGNDPKGMYITTPADSGRRIAEVIRQLDESDLYRPEMSKVTYMGPGNVMVTSEDDILIGPNYYLSLEKTATDGSGTSTTKLGHHGTPTRLTNTDKHSRPTRETGTKTNGEAENRNIGKSTGTHALAEVADLHNNPTLLRMAASNILTHKTPTNIDEIIPRDTYKLGGARPLTYMGHMFLCSGVELTRDDVE